jgi:phosphatidylserine/phosphatidylglycerophosphate/cardiolipin synthase-like enzyme
LDPRSILWNTETGAFIHQTDIAQQLRTLALSALDTRYCYKLIRNAENQINWITSVSKRRQGKRHFQLTVLHSEPGNWLRKLQKMLGRFLPERYL